MLGTYCVFYSSLGLFIYCSSFFEYPTIVLYSAAGTFRAPVKVACAFSWHCSEQQALLLRRARAIRTSYVAHQWILWHVPHGPEYDKKGAGLCHNAMGTVAVAVDIRLAHAALETHTKNCLV